MTSLLRRLAAASGAQVFAIAGGGSRHAVQDLRLAAGVELVDSPRAANVLLVAGPIVPAQWDAVRGAHDALPHPRATVRWADTADDELGPDVARVGVGADPAAAIRAAHRDLMLGIRMSEPPLLPDEDPAPWRGVGPYGQGGSGMTGGTPYGRPMAELAPDRDGLRLDLLPTRLGPFFPHLVHGLELQLRVAGDVIAAAAVAASETVLTPGAAESPFLQALDRPVPIAEIELARARGHLRWLSDALRLQGLDALAIRSLRLAHDVAPGDTAAVGRLGSALSRSGLYRWSLPSVDAQRRALLAGGDLGPASRAFGASADERSADPAYAALGFRPIVLDGAGPSAVWRARLAEAAASLDLAGRAGDARTSVTGSVESPRGRLAAGDPPTARALGMLPSLIEGLEWGDALATIASLDLDLDELAAASPAAAA